VTNATWRARPPFTGADITKTRIEATRESEGLERGR